MREGQATPGGSAGPLPTSIHTTEDDGMVTVSLDSVAAEMPVGEHNAEDSPPLCGQPSGATRSASFKSADSHVLWPL